MANIKEIHTFVLILLRGVILHQVVITLKNVSF